MTQEHTKEPWRVVKNRPRKVTATGVLICNAVIRNSGTTKQNKNGKGEIEAEANARRIVACVNALAGISTEAIEGGVIAELVEALERIKQKHWPNQPAYKIAEEALAKLEPIK